VKSIVCTVVTRNYLHLARVLMRSVASAFPAAERHVLVIDSAAGHFDPAAEPFTVTFAADLTIPRFAELAFVNDATSLCCLLKPAFARHLLQRSTADTAVIYADADVFFYRRPDTLLELLERSPVALTPHALAPPAAHAPVTDADFMRAGAFNAGVFGVRRGAEAETFLTWWLAAMCQARRLDTRYGYDQQFLSLASVYFPWIGVLRDPGCNAAYWNISERTVNRRAGEGLTAGDRPLSIFHYSFFELSTPELLANRPPIIVPAPNAVMQEMQRDYAACIVAADAATCRQWPYGYDCFSDGTRLTAGQREYYLTRIWHDGDHSGSPFDPGFSSAHYRGGKSVYAYEQPLPVWGRRLQRLLQRRASPSKQND
jgi:hypothetical protein